jgi:hypothetical protein
MVFSAVAILFVLTGTTVVFRENNSPSYKAANFRDRFREEGEIFSSGISKRFHLFFLKNCFPFAWIFQVLESLVFFRRICYRLFLLCSLRGLVPYSVNLVNLNTATHSRSKSLLMVFGARVVIAHQQKYPLRRLKR